MKKSINIRNCFLVLLLATLAGCYEPDTIANSSTIDMTSLNIRGQFIGKNDVDYYGTFNSAKDTCYIEVPFYISESEMTLPDITRMKLIATLPTGSMLTPSLVGVHDLSEPFNVQLTLSSGKIQNFTIIARRNRSNEKNITKMTITELPQIRTVVVNKEGDEPSEIRILYAGTDHSIFNSVTPQFTVSGWATVNASGKYNFNQEQTFVVTAQNGTTKTYKTKIVLPEILDYGVGVSNLLWAKHAGDSKMGFTKDANNIMVVVGDELIVNNRYYAAYNADAEFLRYNRFTGDLLPKKVKGSNPGGKGISIGDIIFGLDADDNGTLIAVNFCRVTTAGANAAAPNLIIWAWKNGLDADPVMMLNQPLNSEGYAFLKNAVLSSNPGGIPREIGRSIAVKGDLKGKAQIYLIVGAGSGETYAYYDNRVLHYTVEGGEITNKTTPNVITMGSGGNPKIGWRGKIILNENEPNSSYFMCTQDAQRAVYYFDKNNNRTQFNLFSTMWQTTSINEPDPDLKSIGTFEFNHARLMGVLNGKNNSTKQNTLNKLYVFDVTMPTTGSFQNNMVMDAFAEYGESREGCLSMNWGLKENGAAVPNGNKVGDVTFGLGQDGETCIVYMLGGNQGIVAYELTKYAK